MPLLAECGQLTTPGHVAECGALQGCRGRTREARSKQPGARDVCSQPCQGRPGLQEVPVGAEGPQAFLILQLVALLSVCGQQLGAHVGEVLGEEGPCPNTLNLDPAGQRRGNWYHCVKAALRIGTRSPRSSLGLEGGRKGSCAGSWRPGVPPRCPQGEAGPCSGPGKRAGSTQGTQRGLRQARPAGSSPAQSPGLLNNSRCRRAVPLHGRPAGGASGPSGVRAGDCPRR